MYRNGRKGGERVKIKQFAESRGVSRQAVYNAIKKNGLQTGQLVDSSGNLTDEGIATLDKFFPAETVNRQADKLQNTVSQQQATIDRLSGIIDSQQKELEKLADVIRSQQETIDRLATMADRESTNVSQAQQITAMMKLSREPWLKRLFAGKKEQPANVQP
jgi:predicted ribosome quality control (RQC) complex YloA/Tae2 family protein